MDLALKQYVSQADFPDWHFSLSLECDYRTGMRRNYDRSNMDADEELIIIAHDRALSVAPAISSVVTKGTLGVVIWGCRAMVAEPKLCWRRAHRL